MTTWNAADAKRHFAELLSGSATTPQLIQLRGAPTAVLVSYQDYQLQAAVVGQKSVVDWLAELRSLHAEEGDLDVAPRKNRPDPMADWE